MLTVTVIMNPWTVTVQGSIIGKHSQKGRLQCCLILHQYLLCKQMLKELNGALGAQLSHGAHLGLASNKWWKARYASLYLLFISQQVSHCEHKKTLKLCWFTKTSRNSGKQDSVSGDPACCVNFGSTADVQVCDVVWGSSKGWLSQHWHSCLQQY